MKNNLLFGSYKEETFELDWRDDFVTLTFESSYDIGPEAVLKLFIYNFKSAKYDEYLVPIEILCSEKASKSFRYTVKGHRLEVYKERIMSVFEYANKVINKPYSIYDLAYNEYPELREQYSLYPDSLNDIIDKSFEQFIYKYLKKLHYEEHYDYICENYNGAIYFSSLDPYIYDAFAKNGIANTIEQKIEKAYVNKSNKVLNKIKGICIGNEICYNLMPRLSEIEKIIDETNRIGYKVMYVFPPLQEDNVIYFKNFVEILERKYSEGDSIVEVICNDWGAIHFFKSYDFIHITIGSLLNKYLRDPRRLSYRIKSNFFADSQMEMFYKAYNITSILHSIPENLEEFQVLNNYLMFPFVSFMSSEYCSLVSALIEKNIYRQRPDGDCKKLCAHFVRMYPSHLQCIGIGKANFTWNGNFIYDISLYEKVKAFSNRLIYLDIL